MGLGKTVEVASALEILYKRSGAFRSLVIVPSSLKLNWLRELQLWAPSLSVQRIIGGALDRLAYLHLPYNVIIASYDEIRLAFSENEINELYDIVILDEAQIIKNSSSQVAKSCNFIRRNTSWALTGTPIENKPEDLVSIFKFLQYGLISKGMHIKEIHSLIKKHFLRRTKMEVLSDMPPIVEQELPLELTGNQKQAYENCLSETQKDGSIRNLSTGNLFALITRLKIICNYDEQSNESVKWDMLDPILNDIFDSRQKIIIFSQYVETLKWLGNKLKDYPHDIFSGSLSESGKNKIIDKFNSEPGPRALLISLKAGGVGLNLKTADVVVLFDRWWNPAVEKQAMNRAHRFGREKPLHVLKFAVMATIEEKILEIIAKKEELFHTYVEQAEGFPVAQFKDEIIAYLNNS